MVSTSLVVTAAVAVLTPVLAALFFRVLSRTLGTSLGWYLRRKTDGRRALIYRLTEEHEEEFKKSGAKRSSDSLDEEWEDIDPSTAGTSKTEGNPDFDGIIGFFHPFCNAGGGGERVLWAAIRATQKKWPKAKCVVYTGDHEVTKDKILERVENTFSIHLHAPTITFLYLSTRRFVLASTWPTFTLAGQSLGSLILGWDAFSLVVPDIFVDTMGYAFVLGLSKMLFPDLPTGAYVHYPTISTDMIESLDPDSPLGSRGVNAGKGAGFKGLVKRNYWKAFASVYCWMGASVDVVMTNSTWTQAHIKKLWGPGREKRSQPNPIVVVYPPCAVRELEKEIEVSEESEKQREKALLYIAQFRPEKNHTLIVNSFAEFVNSGSEASKNAKLVLVGSVRDDSDSKRVYQLRLMVNELGIKDRVTFQLDASWPDILQWLGKAYVGVNGMWNEHFGIGCVEYQAAGLIGVVHNSGGPKLDIFTEVDGEPTGFHASTATEFAQGYEKALSLPDPLSVRKRGRISARRFTEEEFARRWLAQMDTLVAMKK